MRYVRNIFCLVVIAFVACLFYLTETGNTKAKEWVQAQIKTTFGSEIEIGLLEFKLPRTIIFNDLTLKTTYGPIQAKKLTLTAPFFKWIFGNLSEGTVHLEGITAKNPSLAALPKDLLAYVTWDEERSNLEGEIRVLENEGPFSYQILEKGTFKVELAKNPTLSLPYFECHFGKVRVQDCCIEKLGCQGSVDLARQTGIFSFAIDSAQYSLSTPNSTQSSTSAIRAMGILGHGEWDLKNNEGGFSLAIDKTLDKHFSLSNATMNLATKGDLSSWKYEVSSQGFYEDPFIVALKGSLTLNKNFYQIKVDKLDGSLADHSLHLVEPVQCLLREDLNFTLSQSQLALDAKKFQLSGVGDRQGIDLKLKLPKQPFSYSVEAQPIAGILSGQLLLKGPYHSLQGKLSVMLDRLSIDHPSIDKNTFFSAQLSADLADKRILVNGSLDDNQTRLLELQGSCPIEKKGLLKIMPSRDKEMALNIFGRIDLARCIHKMIPLNVWVSGHSVVDLHVTGPFYAPKLKGHVKLIDGNFESWKTGTLLQNINADFGLSNDRAILHTFKAFDSQGGTVTAVGDLSLVSALNYPFHVNLSLDHLSAIELDDMVSVLSGTLAFAGNAKGATLKGELFTDQLDFTVDDESPNIDHDIEVKYVNQNSHEVPPTQPSKTTVKWPICFDVRVSNRENILIHSKEFKSEWKGDVKISGCNSQALYNGDFRLLHGKISLPDYLFPGKKFKMTQGTISFAGELNKKTTLYVVGEMEIDNIVVQVIVKGPLNNPGLTFRSNPPLSQREILSWILFGRGMEDITPFQGAELTQSINQLRRGVKSHNNKNPNFLSSLARLKENLGIDRIGIDRSGKDGKEEISLHVGKYIMPDVFLGIKRNMSSDVNRIGLEANLRRNLKIQAEVGDDTDGQLHLKWKHDY